MATPSLEKKDGKFTKPGLPGASSSQSAICITFFFGLSALDWELAILYQKSCDVVRVQLFRNTFLAQGHPNPGAIVENKAFVYSKAASAESWCSSLTGTIRDSRHKPCPTHD